MEGTLLLHTRGRGALEIEPGRYHILSLQATGHSVELLKALTISSSCSFLRQCSRS